ncbi:hypothetical protein YC2023_081709 [Brassica napus]
MVIYHIIPLINSVDIHHVEFAPDFPLQNTSLLLDFSSRSFTNEQLTEMVIQLKTQMKQLHQLIKRKKKRSHGT